MKLAENIVEKTGNLVFEEEEAMDFDPAARGILLNNFIQQYGKPYEAVLREYTSNALDEHVLTNQSRPVEISLPTPLSPNLVIRDWGRGMDRNDLRAYSRFGFSSKRDTDEQRGGFGLGSKSGLAIASQFTVSSIKNGKRNVAIIGRDVHGSPSTGYLPETDSDLPNGTTITIPTSEVRRFRTAIEEGIFLGWKPGTILINGQAPDRSVHDAKYFTPLKDFGWEVTGYSAAPGGYYTGKVMIAGVLMEINWDDAKVEDRNLRKGYLSNIIVKLDNGSVELLRSREGLIFDARTIKAINDRVDDLVGIARVEYQNQIDQCSTFREAVKIRLKAEAYGFKGDYSWKGESLKFDAYTGDKKAITAVTMDYSEKAIRQSSSVEYITQHGIRSVLDSDNTILIYGDGTPFRKTVNSQELHPGSNLIHWYFRDLAEKNATNIREPRLFFTSMTLAELKAARLDKLITKLVPVQEVLDDIATYRKASMAAARKANKLIKVTPAAAEVNVLNYSQHSSCYARTIELGKLDTTKTYVLLQTGMSPFADRVKRAVTTRVGYNDDTKLADFVKAMILGDEITVLVANKSDDTAEYGKVIKLVSIEDAIQTKINTLQAGFTEVQLIALRDMQRNSAYWVTRLKDSTIPQVTNDDTRNWAAAIRDRSIQSRFEMASAAAKLATMYNALTAPANVVAVSDKPSPATRYPMLQYSGYSHVPDNTVLEYMKMVDESLANQLTP